MSIQMEAVPQLLKGRYQAGAWLIEQGRAL
jgi:hypothetical protein